MKALGGLCVGASAFVLLMGQAAAQDIAQIPTPVPAYPGNALGPAAVGPEGTTVMNRPRPDYDPLGVRAGSFIMHPSIGLSETYDSNIFATPSGAKSDLYTTASPGLSVESDWNRHAIQFNATGQFKQYASHPSENVNNATADLRGRYDISYGQYFIADGGYALQHEDRSSPDAVADAKNPVEYHVTGGYLAYVREVGRIGLRVDGTVTSYDYNNQATTTGAIVHEQDRDRIEYVVAPRVSYELTPGYHAFVRVVGNMRRYNEVDFATAQANLAATGVATSARRNSHGYEVDAGTAIELTRVITAEIYVGFLHQEYDSPLFANVNGPAFGGNLLWSPTPLTTVKGSFSQSVAETTLLGSSSSQETNVQLTVEHELLRNVLLVASAGYVHDDYQGITRVDNTYGADAGARYLINRNLRATADISYSNRSSSVGANYDRVIGIVGVTLGF